MRGEPLVLCHHEGEEAIWHRAHRRCPLCRALEEVARLRAQLQARDETRDVVPPE